MDNENFNVEFGEVVNIGGGTSDFNQLSNRPKYNNTTMTGATNIPKAPTKTSDLTNDGSDGTSTYVESDDLATVATSGSYNDLSNTPTIPEAQVQSDWSQTDNTKVDFIKNKPTIPSAQVNADWNASSGVAEILNKPTIPTVNDATLTITQNGTTKGTFTANDADDTTIEVSDTTYSAFTGTDGTAAGTAGLVPAPATTDAGKFLKADGTWVEVGAGGSTMIELTTADYNYPVDNPTVIALWLLQPGVYHSAIATYGNVNKDFADGGVFIVGNSGSYKEILAVDSGNKVWYLRTNPSNGNSNIQHTLLSDQGLSDKITNNLTTTSAGKILDARQGKTLKDLVDSLAVRASDAPTTSTVGVLGQLYTDTTNMHTYQCTAISGGTYTWTQRW